MGDSSPKVRGGSMLFPAELLALPAEQPSWLGWGCLSRDVWRALGKADLGKNFLNE